MRPSLPCADLVVGGLFDDRHPVEPSLVILWRGRTEYPDRAVGGAASAVLRCECMNSPFGVPDFSPSTPLLAKDPLRFLGSAASLNKA